MRMLRSFATAAGVALLAGSALAGTSPPFDHLACFGVKEAKGSPKTVYTVTLSPREASEFGVPTGCSIKLPAKLLCTDVSKTNVSPTPPGAPASTTGGKDYLCYKMKCGKRALTTSTVTDQFGSRSIGVTKPTWLCAPATVGTASPTGAFLDGMDAPL